MIVKVQKPAKHPTGMWLVFQESGKDPKLAYASALPQMVQDAVVTCGGWAYFEATFDGKAYAFIKAVSGQTW